MRRRVEPRQILAGLVFLVGLLIFIYPAVSRYYYRVNNTKVVQEFTEAKVLIDPEEVERRISLARAYNASLNGLGEYKDPYVDNVEEGVADYARMLEVKEKIGVVRVPSLDIEEPVFAGTAEEILQKGVGHMEYTSLPVGGPGTHAVLTGHRGLPDAKIFTDLNKMKEGDLFLVENLKETLAYEVDQIKVIEPSVFDDLYIVPNMDYVTLLTCTPYMINTHRLLIRGHRTEYNPEEVNKALELAKLKKLFKLAALIVAVILLVFLILYGRKRRERSRRRRRERR